MGQYIQRSHEFLRRSLMKVIDSGVLVGVRALS